ncbi:MAG TPA: hypothetical protein DCS87_00025 [Rheinheimera sp.]|nr:hypothetical protein [Rheinheimera sp.]
MLTKRKVLHLALALTKAGDSDLLKGNSLFTDQALNVDDRERVKEIGRIVHDLCQDYSYIRSAAYGLEISTKSASVVDMKAKMESAPARKRTVIGQPL